MANIKMPTHLTFWHFNDTSENIWFSTFRLIEQPKNPVDFFQTQNWQKRLSLFAVKRPQGKNLTASFRFVVDVTQTLLRKKTNKISKNSRQITGTAHPSGKKALMILSPSGLMANSGILWKSSRLQTGGDTIKIRFQHNMS